MMNLLQTLEVIVVDGYRNNINSSTIPTEINMKNGMKDVQGFIVPMTNVNDVKAWVELSEKMNLPIYGWKLIPQQGKEPRVSVQQAIAILKSKNLLQKNQTVFIDARKAMYDTDCTKNKRFVVEMYDELQMHLGGPERIGCFTKREMWMEKYCDMKWDNVRLWYVNQNKKPTFGDFTSANIFGNWRVPFAKQYDQRTIKDKEGDEDVDYTFNLDYIKVEAKKEV